MYDADVFISPEPEWVNPLRKGLVALAGVMTLTSVVLGVMLLTAPAGQGGTTGDSAGTAAGTSGTAPDLGMGAPAPAPPMDVMPGQEITVDPGSEGPETRPADPAPTQPPSEPPAAAPEPPPAAAPVPPATSPGAETTSEERREKPEPGTGEVGAEIWDYVSLNPNGGYTDYRPWKGKPIIIHTTTLGCGTCVKQATKVGKLGHALQDKYAGRAVVVIHENQAFERSQMAEYAQKHGWNGLQLSLATRSKVYGDAEWDYAFHFVKYGAVIANAQWNGITADGTYVNAIDPEAWLKKQLG